VYYVYFPGIYINSYRIKLINDRVIDSEIIISLIGFTFYALIGGLKRRNADHLVSEEIKIYGLKENIENYAGILSVLVLAIQSVVLIYLKTRMTWVSIILMYSATFYILSFYYHDKVYLKRLLVIVFSATVISLAVNLFIPSNSEKERQDTSLAFKSIFDENYYSNQARLSFWNASLKMFKENPIKGIGGGKWPGLYPMYNGEFYNDENVDINSAINPHNDYLEILTEYGIFGFVIFTGFIFAGIYFLFKSVRTRIAFLPFLLSSIGLCITMFFSFTKDNFWAMLVISVCMGVGYSFNNQLSIINFEFFKKNKVILKRLMLIAAFIFLGVGIWFKVMSYLNEREYIESMQLKAQGKYGEMLEKLNGVSSLYYPVDMNKMPVDYYRGVGFFELKQYDKALEKFRNAREFMRYYPTIMNNEASALYMTGMTNEAESLYLEIGNIFPNYFEPQVNLLSLYANERRFIDLNMLLIHLNRIINNKLKIKNFDVFLSIKEQYLKP
jgi:tetratricopeptide (TPR) repeat protein